jgi:prolyl oligopeptidase
MSARPYPPARRSETVYTLHGHVIPEPYEYLEDPGNPETKEFVTAQNARFNEYMASSQDLRDRIEASVTAIQHYARTGAPTQHGAYLYYDYNTGLQNQNVLMRALVEDPTQSEVFLDPNTMSVDGTSALLTTAWSDDDRYLAYSVCDKGSDWQHLHVRDATTLMDLDDRIEWAKFTGIAWWGHVGFFYLRFPALQEGVEKGAETDCAANPFLCFHRIGTPQAEDVIVIPADPAHPQWSYNAHVSHDQKYLVVEVEEGCEPCNMVWVAPLPATVQDLCATTITFTKPVAEMQHLYKFVGNDGAVFYFVTTRDAPNRRIVAIDVADASEMQSKEKEVVVVEERTSVLNEVALVRNTLFLVYLEDVNDTLYTRELQQPSDAAQKVDLPTGSFLSLKADRHTSLVSFKIASFLMPGRVYVTTAENPRSDLKVFAEDTIAGFHVADYTTEQRFYTVADGTRIPMFLTYKKGSLSAQSPVLLFGYGGFNIALKPVFSPFRLMFLQNMNGVLAIPNIRGGGEYGQAWHDAGRRANKHNCFSDFIAAAEFLHDAGIGSTATTAAMGRSNGGLLMGAVANRAPERFACVVCQVGVMDMLKFHKYTIGAAWMSDYGNPDVKEDFEVVAQYSPLHNIRAGVQYPAILVVTGDHDDRVVPLHSLKYIATLQHTNPELGGPFVARIDESGGHGQGKPTSKLIREEADIYAFIAKNLKVTWVDA